MKATDSPYYMGIRSNNLFNEIGKTVKFSADVYTNTSCELRIYVYTGSYSTYNTSIPLNTLSTYSIQHSIPSNASLVIYRVEPRIYSSLSNFVYVDNLQLELQ